MSEGVEAAVESSPDEDDDPINHLRAQCSVIESAVSRRRPRSRTADDDEAEPCFDLSMVQALLAKAHASVRLPPCERDPEVLTLVLRCLANGALLHDPSELAEADGLLALVEAAAGSADVFAPPTTQHVAMMLLLNLSRAASAAPAVACLKPMLEGLGRSDDPRLRSLSSAVLKNLSLHGGGLIARLSLPDKARLQQVTPATMLGTISRLESGVSTASPPRTPQNTRIPGRLVDATKAEAILSSPSAVAAVEAAEAKAVGEEFSAGAGGAVSPSADPAAGAPPPSPPPPPPSPPEGRLSANGGEAAAAGGDAAAAARGSSALLTGEGAAALAALRMMSQELYLSLGLAPIARATAAWGARKAGVVLSAVASVLQRVPAGRAWVVAGVMHSGGAAARLATVHAAARADGDWNAAEAALWCLASYAHGCGGRFLELGEERMARLLFGCLAPATPLCERLCALSALRCAAADVRSVPIVARHVAKVHERFTSQSDEEVELACAVVSNVEQYSHARLWFSIEHKSSALSTFEPPPPPPPPPAVLYSAAVPPPEQLERALAALPAEGEGLADVALVPQLACALHPWVSPRLRESAALRLARLLMLAWKRGTHDETLLYLLESSLAARRLAYALHGFGSESAAALRTAAPPNGWSNDGFSEAAAQACLFCLAVLPLLGGGATVFGRVVLDRILPVVQPPTSLTHPVRVRLALASLQNASSDPRAASCFRERGKDKGMRQKLVDTLWAAAALPHAAASDLALGTIANLAAVATARSSADEELTEASFALPLVMPEPAAVGTFHREPPPALPLPPAAASPSAEGYRALPRLCVSLTSHAPHAALRRALGSLVVLLSSRSLDAATALSLLSAYGCVDRLVALATAPSEAKEDGSAKALIRDAALVLLGLVYGLGGARLVAPHLSAITPPAIAALVSTEPRARMAAAFFWHDATAAKGPATSLARATVPAGKLAGAGIPIGKTATGGAPAFCSGLGVMRRLATSAPDASPADGRLALLAAGAVSHVLQHSSLSHLWTSAPDSLSYLERLSEEEAAELVALPISLAKEGVMVMVEGAAVEGVSVP